MNALVRKEGAWAIKPLPAHLALEHLDLLDRCPGVRVIVKKPRHGGLLGVIHLNEVITLHLMHKHARVDRDRVDHWAAWWDGKNLHHALHPHCVFFRRSLAERLPGEQRGRGDSAVSFPHTIHRIVGRRRRLSGLRPRDLDMWMRLTVLVAREGCCRLGRRLRMSIVVL
jgi:hypothetical protein